MGCTGDAAAALSSRVMEYPNIWTRRQPTIIVDAGQGTAVWQSTHTLSGWGSRQDEPTDSLSKKTALYNFT
jgi:hypothetical protein